MLCYFDFLYETKKRKGEEISLILGGVHEIRKAQKTGVFCVSHRPMFIGKTVNIN